MSNDQYKKLKKCLQERLERYVKKSSELHDYLVSVKEMITAIQISLREREEKYTRSCSYAKNRFSFYEYSLLSIERRRLQTYFREHEEIKGLIEDLEPKKFHEVLEIQSLFSEKM